MYLKISSFVVTHVDIVACTYLAFSAKYFNFLPRMIYFTNIVIDTSQNTRGALPLGRPEDYTQIYYARLKATSSRYFFIQSRWVPLALNFNAGNQRCRQSQKALSREHKFSETAWKD
jgi:hypothetical protein